MRGTERGRGCEIGTESGLRSTEYGGPEFGLRSSSTERNTYLQIFLYTQLYFVIYRATINLMYAYYGFVLSMESVAT